MTYYSSADSLARQLPRRSAFVRLGPGGPYIHSNATHACVGVTNVEAIRDSGLPCRTRSAGGVLDETDGWILKATTDWEDDWELTYMALTVDAQLAAKGIVGGPSGGMTTTEFQIYTTREIPTNASRPTGAVYLPGSCLPPQGAWANPNVDNVQIVWDSIRKTA
jgi:hypothetical protein